MNPTRISAPRAWLAALMAAGALWACSPSTASAPDASQGDDAGLPGDPDAGTEPQVDAGEPPPTWDNVSFDRRWLREGFGEAKEVRSVDVDHNGKDEVLVGARGVALVDEAARSGAAPRWSVDWYHDPADILSGGENTWVYAMELTDVNGDLIQDALVINSDRDAYALDGATGAELWRVRLDAEFLATRMATFDGNQDGVADFFPSGGYSAYSGKTGEKLWTAQLPRPAVFVTAGNLDTGIGTDLLITTEEDGCVGICPPPDPDAPPVMNVHAVSSTGQTIYDAHVDGTVASATTADLDGDGVDEAIVGNDQGVVFALDGTGTIRWSVDLGDNFVTQLVAGEVDFDGRADLFAAHVDISASSPSEVVGLSPDGVVLWRQEVGPLVNALRLFQLDEDLAPELLVAAGTDYPSSGFALALETPAMVDQREQWRVDTGMPVDSFVIGNIDKSVLLIGARDSQVRAVEPATGALDWTWSGGGYVFATAAGDLDGDRLDEVISGDDRGLLIAARPGDGTRAWTHRMDVGNAGQVSSVVTADVLPGGAAEVVASANAFNSKNPGVVEVYDAAGALKWSLRFPASVEQVKVADLDGDGAMEILTAERGNEGLEGTCAVRALTAAGDELWRTEVSHCEIPTIDAGDVDGDGKLEIAYAERTLFSVPQTALLESTGALRWKVPAGDQGDDGAWVFAVPGGVLKGGFAGNYQGHVTLHSQASGEPVWQKFIPGLPDPILEGGIVDSGSWSGALVPDQDGDGTQEIAVTTDADEVHLLNGASGELLWTTRLEALNREPNQRHLGGPIVWVPATKKVPGFLAVGESSSPRTRAKAFTLQPEDGTVLAGFEMEGEAHAIAAARFAADSAGAVVGAGLGVHAVEALKQ